jgi:hypothetical protein
MKLEHQSLDELSDTLVSLLCHEKNDGVFLLSSFSREAAVTADLAAATRVSRASHHARTASDGDEGCKSDGLGSYFPDEACLVDRRTQSQFSGPRTGGAGG